MTLGIGIMIAGGLLGVLGAMFLINHSGMSKVIVGIILLAVGLGGLAAGYGMDQNQEVTYTVTEVTAVSARDTDNVYRVTLKAESGTETWIYLTDNQLTLFPKNEQVTMRKKQLKVYTQENANNAANAG